MSLVSFRHLGKNQIMTIPDGAFASTPNVKTLYLSENNIGEVSNSTFKGTWECITFPAHLPSPLVLTRRAVCYMLIL